MASISKNNQWFDENAADCDFIRTHENLEPLGPIHKPVSSALILQKFREKAASLGLNLVNEKGALKRDGRKFMYVADVTDASHPDYALSVGFRNSSDKSLAFKGSCGTSVFICENGCMSCVVKPSKMRHSIGNVGNEYILDSRIGEVFKRFEENRGFIEEQVGLMKSTPLTDEIVGKFVRRVNGNWEGDRFARNPLVGAANLMRILAELDRPTLNDRDDSSVFRLLNAATYVTTHVIKNPEHGQSASHMLNDAIMSIIKPNFVPLGDADEIEVEVID